jgi:hypothetical protein
MKALRIAKIAWLSVFILASTVLIVTYNPTTNRDNDIVLAYLLIVLTFPAGLAVLACGRLLLDFSSVESIPVGRFGMCVTSALFLCVGYCWWCALLPALWTVSRKIAGRLR